jgi:hypothetical protein
VPKRAAGAAQAKAGRPADFFTTLDSMMLWNALLTSVLALIVLRRQSKLSRRQGNFEFTTALRLRRLANRVLGDCEEMEQRLRRSTADAIGNAEMGIYLQLDEYKRRRLLHARVMAFFGRRLRLMEEKARAAAFENSI